MEARYGEDTRNRTSEGITAADLRDPQYSYMSAVYGQKAPTQNVVDGNDPNRPSRRYPSDEYIAKRDRALSQGREQRSSSNSDAYRVTRPTDPSAVNDISPERPGYDGLTPVRRRSIPRKQVGSGLSTPVSPPLPSSRTSPNPSPMHARQSSAHDKPLPSTPVSTTGAGLGLGYGGDRSAQPSFDEGRMLVQGAKEKPSLDGILDLSNTRDTVVIEKFAPGTFVPVQTLTGSTIILTDTEQLWCMRRYTRKCTRSVKKLSLAKYTPTMSSTASSPSSMSKYFLPDTSYRPKVVGSSRSVLTRSRDGGTTGLSPKLPRRSHLTSRLFQRSLAFLPESSRAMRVTRRDT